MPVNPIPCPGDGSTCAEITQMVLCDQHPSPDAGDGLIVKFIRTFSHNCATGEILTSFDTDFDGLPYTVLGTVEDCCAEVVPVSITPRSFTLSGITGPTTVGNAPVVSISIFVRTVGATGSVVLTLGLDTIVALAGEVYTWSVIRDDDSWVGSVQIDTTNASDDVLVIYSEAV